MTQVSPDMVERAARTVWDLRCAVARKAKITPPLDAWEDELEGLREAVRAEVTATFTAALGDTHVIVPRSDLCCVVEIAHRNEFHPVISRLHAIIAATTPEQQQ